MKAEETLKQYHIKTDELQKDKPFLFANILRAMEEYKDAEGKEVREINNKAIDLLCEWIIIGHGFDPKLKEKTNTFLKQLKNVIEIDN